MQVLNDGTEIGKYTHILETISSKDENDEESEDSNPHTISKTYDPQRKKIKQGKTLLAMRLSILNYIDSLGDQISDKAEYVKLLLIEN